MPMIHLKNLQEVENISKEDILQFASSLEVLSEEDRQTLIEMTPASYIGLADVLANIKL